MRSIEVRFRDDNSVQYYKQVHQRERTPFEVNYSLSVGMTYEEIIQLLIERQFLLPLDDGAKYNRHLRYSLHIFAYHKRYTRGAVPYPNGKLGAGYVPDYWHIEDYPYSLSEGQTLASIADYFHPFREAHSESQFPDGIEYLTCTISIEAKSLLSQEGKPSSVTPSWDKIVNALLTSLAANTINFAASIVTIATVLIAIEKSWSKKHATDSESSQRGSLQPSETEIVAIRLRMTHGDDPEFEEWLTDPKRLKHYIDVFNQPSSSTQPSQAIFVQRNGKVLKVDVSKGAQNNLQLDELLSYLNSDSAQK